MHRCALVFLGISAVAPTAAEGQVTCWAPGIPEAANLVLTEGNRSVAYNLPGKPYRYDIYGVAGKLKLGNKAAGAITSNNTFRGGLLGTGGSVNSTAFVMLQTALLTYYPLKLEVSGKHPGTSAGPVHHYGPLWTLSDPIDRKTVSLRFHLPASGLLGGLLPGIASPAYYNQNPEGYFYLLGVYHPEPPVMTGLLNVSSDQVIHGSPVNLNYSFVRYDAPIYRPPFLGLDLGDVGLTVLGTPPQTPSNGPLSQNLSPVTTGLSSALSVAVDLTLAQGEGWLKINIGQ